MACMHSVPLQCRHTTLTDLQMLGQSIQNTPLSSSCAAARSYPTALFIAAVHLAVSSTLYGPRQRLRAHGFFTWCSVSIMKMSAPVGVFSQCGCRVVVCALGGGVSLALILALILDLNAAVSPTSDVMYKPLTLP
eukprot:TRINITY_DN2631_c0_g1_i3.p2 TRINITY_DN2631_c0_g1~~TRINITY_DN2631_c0_g1_i3.p2  ORF type:complete len:135 (-),score=2.91 TRINITY_DN2631_c0_g1_i3:1955-2359(-)